MTFTRPRRPGDGASPRDGRENESTFLNRVHLGQIKTVNEEFGTLNVWVFDIEDFVTVEIPMSMMSIQRTASSWMRYIPDPTAFVLIGYTLQNQPYCMGYALRGNDPSATSSQSSDPNTGAAPNQSKYVPHIGGYKRLAQAKKDSDAGKKERASSKDSTLVPIGLRDFTPLKSGEWDIRSKGGAYIRGSRFGQLVLSAAQDFILVDKQRDEISTRSALLKVCHRGPLTSNGVSLDPADPIDDTQFRVGDVKRQLLPTDTNDSKPTGAGREWFLHVDQPIGCAATGFTYDERIGDVWGDGPVPIVAPITRIKKQLTGLGGINLFKFTVDALGNVEIDHGAPTLSVNINGGVGTSLSTSFASTNISSSIDTSITSGAATFIKSTGVTNADGLAVLLGNAVLAATQPNVHGTVLLTLLTELLAGLLALANAKNPPPTFSKDPDYVPLQTLLTTLTTQLALPPGPAPGPVGPLLSAKVFGE